MSDADRMLAWPLCGCEESDGVFGCGVGCACRCHVIEAQLAERGAQCAAMREALEKLETVARRAPQSARLASARASARAALAPGAGRACRAELIERCAKVAEAYEPECESCPRGVAAAIRALDKEGM